MIQYLQDTMWRSSVLHVILSVFLLIEDSRKPCLSRIFKSKKPVLRLGIDSLKPLNTFPYPGYNSRTIRTTLKIKSFKIITLIFTVFYLQKGFKRAKIGSFWDSFFAIFSILGHDIKNRSQGRNNLLKYYKKHYKCYGFTPITFEKIAKNDEKKVANGPFSHFSWGGGILLETVYTTLEWSPI